MDSHSASLIALSLAWIAYGALHSMLAAQGAKRWLAAVCPA